MKLFYSLIYALCLFISNFAQISFQPASFGPQGDAIFRFTKDTKGNLYSAGVHMYKSSDGGTSLKSISGHLEANSIAVTPEGVIFAAAGLMYRSTDDDKRWNSLTFTQFSKHCLKL